MSKRKSDIAVGDKILFRSGNFEGLYGKVLEVNFNSKDPKAIYGIWHKVQLSNGKIGFIEKNEHWVYFNRQQIEVSISFENDEPPKITVSATASAVETAKQLQKVANDIKLKLTFCKAQNPTISDSDFKNLSCEDLANFIQTQQGQNVLSTYE